MKQILFEIIFLNVSAVFAQSPSTISTAPKTEILQGSQQQMMSECGLGKTSIKQTVITTNIY